MDRDARVDGDFSAIADHDNPPKFRSEIHIGGKIDVREHLEDHIYTIAFGQRQNLIQIAGSMMIKHVMRTQLRDIPSSLLSSPCCDDRQSSGPG